MELISVFGAVPVALCEKVFLSGKDCIKRMTIEMFVAVLAIPVEVIFGTIGPYCTAMVFMMNVICLFYTYYIFHREKPRSKFFTIYMISSVLYMILVFEYSVPLFELLPEENLILVLLVLATIYYLYLVQKNAPGNVSPQAVVPKNELAETVENCETTTALMLDNIELLNDGNDNNTSSFYCTICQVSSTEWDHHNFWLNCCIDKRNHRSYFLALIGAELALLLGIYLTLTAICHPVLIARIWSVPILAPDDCHEVYELIELTAPFIMSIYALLMAACILFAIVKQCVNISRRNHTNSTSPRQTFSKFKTILQNWRSFLQ